MRNRLLYKYSDMVDITAIGIELNQEIKYLVDSLKILSDTNDVIG